MRERRCSIAIIDDKPLEIAARLDRQEYGITLISPGHAADLDFADIAADVILVGLSAMQNHGIRILQEIRKRSTIPVVALVKGRDFFDANYQLRMATLCGASVSVVLPAQAYRLEIAIAQALVGRG